jgi:glycosyltransferase involved in cell wall biosynthesis
VSAGSREIKNFLSGLNNNIHHTSSPIVDLKIVKKNRSPLFTVGWIGGFAGDHKQTLLSLIFPALKELTFKLKFILIGVQNSDDVESINKYFKDKSNLKIEIPTGINWLDEPAIQKRILQFDIGIATLTDSLLQLSKSGIKVKQYFNNGVPVLSSNLPENNTFMVDGVNGFLCSTTNEFKERISQFYEMTDGEYWQFSKKARESICNFDRNNYLSQFEKIKID